jgi:hypothetical protein
MSDKICLPGIGPITPTVRQDMFASYRTHNLNVRQDMFARYRTHNPDCQTGYV